MKPAAAWRKVARMGRIAIKSGTFIGGHNMSGATGALWRVTYRPACGDDACSDCADRRDCEAHAVDWRARALAAEADAARWRKVAPLIERLADDVRRRELIARAEFDRRIIDTVTALLAATQEPTP